MLLEWGFDPGQDLAGGATSLHYAAAADDAALVRALLDAGADVDAVDEHGTTAVHSACLENAFAAARVLAEAGASVNAADDQGFTQLDNARCWSSPELQAWLEAHGARWNRVTTPWRWPREVTIQCSMDTPIGRMRWTETDQLGR